MKYEVNFTSSVLVVIDAWRCYLLFISACFSCRRIVVIIINNNPWDSQTVKHIVERFQRDVLWLLWVNCISFIWFFVFSVTFAILKVDLIANALFRKFFDTWRLLNHVSVFGSVHLAMFSYQPQWVSLPPRWKIYSQHSHQVCFKVWHLMISP